VTVGGDNRGVDSSPGTMGLHTRTSEIITSEEDLSNIRPKMSVIDSGQWFLIVSVDSGWHEFDYSHSVEQYVLLII
jgi:hypothetical protein